MEPCYGRWQFEPEHMCFLFISEHADNMAVVRFEGAMLLDFSCLLAWKI